MSSQEALLAQLLATAQGREGSREAGSGAPAAQRSSRDVLQALAASSGLFAGGAAGPGALPARDGAGHGGSWDAGGGSLAQDGRPQQLSAQDMLRMLAGEGRARPPAPAPPRTDADPFGRSWLPPPGNPPQAAPPSLASDSLVADVLRAHLHQQQSHQHLRQHRADVLEEQTLGAVLQSLTGGPPRSLEHSAYFPSPPQRPYALQLPQSRPDVSSLLGQLPPAAGGADHSILTSIAQLTQELALAVKALRAQSDGPPAAPYASVPAPALPASAPWDLPAPQFQPALSAPLFPQSQLAHGPQGDATLLNGLLSALPPPQGPAPAAPRPPLPPTSSSGTGRKTQRRSDGDANGGDPKVPRRSSVFRGVTWSRGTWYARIMKGSQEITLGNYTNEIDAARAYDAACHLLGYGVHETNIPEESPSACLIRSDAARKMLMERTPGDPGFRTDARRVEPSVARSRIGSSPYKGARFYSRTGKWESKVWTGSRHLNLGYYATDYDAACAYDTACFMLGKPSRNFPHVPPDLNSIRNRGSAQFLLECWQSRGGRASADGRLSAGHAALDAPAVELSAIAVTSALPASDAPPVPASLPAPSLAALAHLSQQPQHEGGPESPQRPRD
ncbi:unnamed protein product [Pedinophyceae sp. YPF-701]|nr:unnamed protein product [Pedinophyceae sp. YPF-701]